MDFKKLLVVAFVCLVLSLPTVFASAPTIVGVDGNSNTVWRTSTFNITFKDLNFLVGGGISSATYSVNGGAYGAFSSSSGTAGDINYVATISVDGNYRINARFVSTDLNVKDVNGVFGLLDSSAPSVGATSITGFSQIGSNFYGSGSIVGGTAVDANVGLKNGYSDKNTSTCEYTTDGTTWASATWSTDHCVKTGVTINGGHSYQFGTRIADNVGNIGAGAFASVQGAMVAGDVGNVTMDIVGQFLAGIASNAGTLVTILIILVIVGLVVVLLTDTFGIFTKLKDKFNF